TGDHRPVGSNARPAKAASRSGRCGNSENRLDCCIATELLDALLRCARDAGFSYSHRLGSATRNTVGVETMTFLEIRLISPLCTGSGMSGPGVDRDVVFDAA